MYSESLKNETKFGLVIGCLDFRRLGLKQTKPVPNRFKLLWNWFCVYKPNDFVRISDSAEILTVWEWNTSQNVRNPNVWTSDVHFTLQLIYSGCV